MRREKTACEILETMERHGSIRALDVRLLDHSPPFFHVAFDDLLKLRGGAAAGFQSFHLHLASHRVREQHFRNLLVPPRDDTLRYALGTPHCVPVNDLESRHGLTDGWYFGQQLRALVAGDCNGAQPPGPQVRECGNHADGSNPDFCANHCVQRRAAALVGNVNDTHLGLQLEILEHEVRDAADADRGVVELAGTRLGVSDELPDALDWDRGVYRHDQPRGTDQHDGLDAVHGVVWHILVRGRRGVAAGKNDERVAIGFGAHRHLRANGAAGAWPVVDHDCLPERL